MSHDELDASPYSPPVSVRGPIGVFLTLLCLTFLTVFVSTLHLPRKAAIGAALAIAAVKAGLVAAFFMHLHSEKRLIYLVLAFTALFFALLLFLPHWTSPGNLAAHY